MFKILFDRIHVDFRCPMTRLFTSPTPRATSLCLELCVWVFRTIYGPPTDTLPISRFNEIGPPLHPSTTGKLPESFTNCYGHNHVCIIRCIACDHRTTYSTYPNTRANVYTIRFFVLHEIITVISVLDRS